jgi:hypothetical protein
MSTLVVLFLLAWGLMTLVKKAAANPQRTAAWAGLVHGWLKK